MSKRTKVFSCFLIILFLFTFSASAQWKNHSSVDEMTGEKTLVTISPSVSPTVEMDFPYNNTMSRIAVVKKGNDEFVNVNFDQEPNIVDSEIKDGYDLITTRVKWDNKIENMQFYQTWGSSNLQFANSKKVISKLKKHNSVLIEINWYGNGKTYFKFPLNGSSNAINKMINSF